jgi:sulfate adenylyltransferase
MNDQEEYLISYANIKSRLFDYQNNFLDSASLVKFYNNKFYGIPLCLPKNIKYFNYKKANYFKINKKNFSKKIFNTNNLNYIGNKKYFRYGNIFAYNVKLKKTYKKKLKFYLNDIIKIKKKISKISKIKKNVCSMQIRNVPHFGHEAVFKFLLSKFEFLVLNPIYGIKKKNDFSNELISKALNFIKRKYKKIFFIPVWSNFHYGGPREAIHHMILRKNLGFKNFYIGRDHAGAENLYKANEALKLATKFQKKIKIKLQTSLGGYYCKKCYKYLIKGSCHHKKLLNISGTEFRSKLKSKKVYEHADKKLQEKLI